MKYLKLVVEEPNYPTSNLLYIKNVEGKPVLAYNDDSGTVILDDGGSERSRLVKCSDLKEILSGNMIKGTKFLASISNPVLYYLFPGNKKNDELFTSDNDFIPTLKVSELVKNYEVNGFEESGDENLTQNSVRSMKACDNWFVGSIYYDENVAKIDEALDNIYKHYQKFDPDKEVKVGSGYAAEIIPNYMTSGPLINSIAVSPISGTTYTDTINLEDWIIRLFNKDALDSSTDIEGKLDVSFMYSIGGNIRCGMQTIKVCSIMSGPVIINLGDVQLEYIGYVLKIYPLKNEVDEVMINDCIFSVIYQ